MRFAYQTIAWGGRIDDLESVLGQLAAIGYEGIEFAQAPSEIFVRDERSGDERRPVAGIGGLLRLVGKSKLELLGFAGGTVEERISFCGDHRPHYLYMDSWQDAELALEKDPPFTLAIHPHLFMPIRSMNQVDSILEAPENNAPKRKDHVLFLPDTAHLTIVGDDPAEAIRKYKDRLVAIHFKDWQPHFGRYSHRYARGFVPLGEGIVAWDRWSRPGSREDAPGVLDTLRDIGYDGWIVTELDSSPKDPIECALACAEWLAAKGLMKTPDRARLKRLMAQDGPPRQRDVCPPEMELQFLQVLLQTVGKGIHAFYEGVTEAFSRVVPSQLVMLWIFSPEDSRLYLLSAKGLLNVPQISHLKSTSGCIGHVAREMRARDFDLELPEYSEYFEDKPVLAALNPKRMLSIPILNPANAHHLRYVVNVFPEKSAPVPDLEGLARLGEYVAMFADCVMDERCAEAAGRTSYECGQSQSKVELMVRLRRLLLATFDCEGGQIFLVNDGRDRLEEGCHGVTEWTVPLARRYYRKGEGLTGKAWAARDMLFSLDAHHDPRTSSCSTEKRLSPERCECVFAPMVKRGGDVMGVIRLANKRGRPGSACSTMFNDDDAAVLDSIIQAALPRLELLQTNERQLKVLGRMTHEFQGPIVAIRGAVQLMQNTIREHGWSAKQLFELDYLDDVWNWTDLLIAEVESANIFRRSAQGITPKVSKTLLLKDVVAPAIHQVHLLLLERGYLPGRIRHGTFDEVPLLWIDRNQFCQGVFNLLSNAIKYAQDKATFRVDIETGKIGTDYVIWFSDYGIGINPELKEAVFEPGFRAPEAVLKDVSSQGLGLSVVRAVIEAHGGKILLTVFKKPTRFTIYLPDSLERTPPKGAVIQPD